MERAFLVQEVTQIVKDAIRERIFPGCVVGVVTREGQALSLPFGRYTYDSSSREVSVDTLYDVASVTKVIPTSFLAHLFLEKEKVALTTKLIEFVPEYRGDFREEITLYHLLTQTLPFSLTLSSFKYATAREILEAIRNAHLREKPGLTYDYNNTTSILLGMFLERVGGKKLDQLAKGEIFTKLSMERTMFLPGDALLSEIPPTELVDGKEIRGFVHDESARILSSVMTAGSAGLFSTVPDLLSFLEVLLKGGKPLVTFSTIKKMSTAVMLPGNGEEVGLGWEMYQKWMGRLHLKKTIGKTGFTGCMVLADFENGVGIVHLSNHTYPQRGKDRLRMSVFRSSLIDLMISTYTASSGII